MEDDRGGCNIVEAGRCCASTCLDEKEKYLNLSVIDFTSDFMSSEAALFEFENERWMAGQMAKESP